MKAIEIIKILLKLTKTPRFQSRHNRHQLRFLPRKHALLAVSLSVALVIVAYLPPETAIASRDTKLIDLPKLSDSLPIIHAADLTIPTSPEQLAVRSNNIKKEFVKAGDNLSRIFHRAGLTDSDMFGLVNSVEEAKNLANLMPGQQFIFDVSDDGKLITLIHEINRLQSETFQRDESAGFTYHQTTKTPDVQIAMRENTIKTSLYQAGTDVGLDEQLIMELADIFGWDIDFALDLRAGDHFKIMYEEKFLEGERLGTGHILAAEFVNQQTTFSAVLYTDSEGKQQYYSPSGKAMRKAFLRAPLDFRRISSNFDPRRLHPITKTVKPHRGTDYAANRGTPVWAPGDGKVIASGYTSANGNFIVIQHGGDIQTKYLHLDKRKVKKGDRIRQKQIIGTVGTTGLSTAPHLHYEFLLSGVHRNPRTIVQKLPKAESIPDAQLQSFYAQTRPIIAQLEQTTQIAGFSSADGER